MTESPRLYERLRRQVVRGVAWLMLIAAVLLGVIALGRWCLDQLKTDDRFQVAFQDIDCEAPPTMSRVDFLDEVRYILPLPSHLPVADVETHDKLRTAFQKHPWVLSVDEIEPRPPNRLRVQLTFRRPALAVRWKGDIRVVDDRGVLLPLSALATGLPEFAGAASAPGPEGTLWPDPDVVRQALQR